MSRKTGWKKVKNPIVALAAVSLMLLFFVVLLGQNHTAPQNPMDEKDADASQMYLMSQALLTDQSLLDGVANANISAGGQAGEELDSEEQTEEQNEDQEEQQDNTNSTDNPQNEQQEQDSPDGPVNANISGTGTGVNDSLVSLIEKHNPGIGEGTTEDPNQGGGDSGGEIIDDGGGGGLSSGGEESTLSPDKTVELFTTTIVDRETVDMSGYEFSIILTEKGKLLNLVSRSVMVNGYAQNFPENTGTVKLAQGANKIQVTVLFRDNKGNQIKAPTKTYTVYYVKNDDYFLEVLHADSEEAYTNGGQENIAASELQIRIVARKGTQSLADQLSVRMNNSKANVSNQGDGVWNLRFSDGNNALKIILGTNSTNQKTFTYTFNYQREIFTVSMDSPAVTESIQGDQFGKTSRVSYAGDSPENFSFLLSITQATGKESIDHVNVTTRSGTTDMVNQVTNGYRTITLDASRDTLIEASGIDSDGNGWKYTWQITYKRTGETPDSKKPVITLLNLTDNETITYTPYVLTLAVSDYQGNTLYPENMNVVLNGNECGYTGISGNTFEYTLGLQEGENQLAIVITDNQQYSVTRNITFYYDSAGAQVSVTVIVDASNVRLGTLFAETIQVPAGKLVSEIMEERLAAHGYTTNYSGSITASSYYLKSIGKAGLLNGASVSEERYAQLQASGFAVSVPDNKDWLGEFDFSSGSGWVITHNNDYFIGQSMGSRSVRDGDTIHLQFTLDLGTDCGYSS